MANCLDFSITIEKIKYEFLILCELLREKFCPIVPQLSKCLKFEEIQGDQIDEKICI